MDELSRKHSVNADFERAWELIARLRATIAQRIVGKREIVDGILTAFMSDGHVLLEGVPGLAKTLAVRVFAAAAQLSYHRIQFTPDLLPGDITGSLFYDAAGARFVPRKGPIFANIVLADEINRAPAKVQSALLEAMEEKQVSMGDASLDLPRPFFVLATQNPIEHEGTFRLPEAQLDRFMLKLLTDYPDAEEELQIVLENADRAASPSLDDIRPVMAPADVDCLKAVAKAVRFENDAAAYAVALIRASRPQDTASAPQALRELRRYIEFGASPRASLALYRASRAGAVLDGRDFVLPDDVKKAAPSVLRHRIVPSYEAEAERITAESIVKGIVQAVVVP